MVGADVARRLLRDVVDFVRETARSEVEGDTLGRCRLHFPGNRVKSLVPADALEAVFALAPDHRVREPAKIAQVFTGKELQAGQIIAQPLPGHRVHRVELEQVEPDRAEVYATHRPI